MRYRVNRTLISVSNSFQTTYMYQNQIIYPLKVAAWNCLDNSLRMQLFISSCGWGIQNLWCVFDFYMQINRFVAISGLKTYFAVDTKYVLQKLSIVLCPYMHRNWAPMYQSEQQVPPREDINAPDLYIPGTYTYTYMYVYMLFINTYVHCRAQRGQ